MVGGPSWGLLVWCVRRVYCAGMLCWNVVIGGMLCCELCCVLCCMLCCVSVVCEMLEWCVAVGCCDRVLWWYVLFV